MSISAVVPTIPLTQNGKHHGHLRLPYSRDDSAWGNLMLPITVVRNGSGPTALLTGANHGDEYEGPIALHDLALTLQCEQISGTVIIVPALNHPALLAGTRTSPIDRANMNRIFPGRHNGTVSEKIAHYFHDTLVPMADVVLDFHSGGKTIDFVPFVASHVLENKQQEVLCEAAAKAFNAPYYLKMLEIDNVGMYDTVVEQQGKVFVTTELGGGGTTTPATIDIAKRGIKNLLIHANILHQPLTLNDCVELQMPGDDCFVFSTDSGMIEPAVALGQTVKRGDVIAKVWQLDRNGQEPLHYHASRSGMLIGRHFPGLIKPGDFIALIATNC
ncbi:MAG: N(2)-acetyl-L-2,4-diaminobutanoate deacetylase DoeB [Pseudomonadota bacterium]